MVLYWYSWKLVSCAPTAYTPLSGSVSSAAASLKSAQVQSSAGYFTFAASKSVLLYQTPTVSMSFGRPYSLPS
jgi:hypothetical protein